MHKASDINEPKILNNMKEIVNGTSWRGLRIFLPPSCSVPQFPLCAKWKDIFFWDMFCSLWRSSAKYYNSFIIVLLISPNSNNEVLNPMSQIQKDKFYITPEMLSCQNLGLFRIWVLKYLRFKFSRFTHIAFSWINTRSISLKTGFTVFFLTEVFLLPILYFSGSR